MITILSISGLISYDGLSKVLIYPSTITTNGLYYPLDITSDEVSKYDLSRQKKRSTNWSMDP